MNPQTSTRTPHTHTARMEEGELVAAARRSDEAAVRELVRRFNPRLFRIARGIVDSDADAEEVVQETWLTAFTRLDDFRGDSRFATWVGRIAVNAARMRKRGQRSGITPLDTVAEEPLEDRVVAFPGNESRDPYTRAGETQMRQLLESAVAELPSGLRVVFLLRESEGMSIRAIAKDLSLNPITVKTRLFRARRRLHRQLSSRIEGGFDQIFPFDGARCAGMADRVVARLFDDTPTG